MTKSIPFLATATERYGKYAREVLGHRHFPEGRDGLKPVQRRALFTMKRLGAVDMKHLTLAAEIMGTTTGTFHPHADGSVFGALANMSQAKMKNNLIIGVGSWGTHNAEPGAPRYIKCFLSKYAMSMFDTDEMTCVPMDKSYNGKTEEPRFLPARLPHILLSGCDSIAPGFKGKIPPCDANWVIDALFDTIKNKKPMLPKQFAYRWGGKLIKLDKSWLNTGIGSAEFLSTTKIEKGNIIITSLTPNLKIENIEEDLDEDSAFAGLAEESPVDNELVRIVVRVKRGHDLEEFNKRIKDVCRKKEHYSFLQIRQLSDTNGDVDYEPISEGIESFLIGWLAWRKLIVVKAAKHRIAVFNKDLARIELLKRMIDKRRELLKILDVAKDANDIFVRTKIVLRCRDDEAREAMTFAWPRLAFMEVAPLLKKQQNYERQIVINDAIVSKPTKRLLEDAENTLQALESTIAESKLLETGAKRVKNHKSNREGS